MPQLKQLQQHKIVIDTHVLLWSLAGNTNLTNEFHESFERIRATHGILISPMSLWEIGMLVEKKRIHLNCDTMDFVSQILDKPGINLSPVTPRVAVQSCRLPGTIHGDPVGRILIATAYEENAVLVTCDEKILDYGLENYITVFNPSKC